MNSTSDKKVDAPVVFKAGTIIFAQGKNSKYLYLVKKGEVRLMKSKGQSLKVVQICGEREILNETSVLKNKPNEFTAIAKTDVELVLVEQKDVLTVIKNSPAWIPEIFETLCERLEQVESMIEEHNLAGETDKRLVISKDEEQRYLKALTEFNGQG